MSYVDLEDIIDPFVAQIKDEIESLDFIDKLDEGEEVYAGSGVKSIVIPGIHNIRSIGMSTLEITMTLYVLILTASPEMSVPEMRDYGYKVYNKLMEDVKHNNTSWVCLPRVFHPGLLTYGPQTFVGVQMQWETRFHQSYDVPVG